MKITFTVRHQAMDGERSYDSSVELPDKTPLEVIEAHARSMIRILADQAVADCEVEDDDDDEEWKNTVGHS
jgi:hypothetical protein